MTREQIELGKAILKKIEYLEDQIKLIGELLEEASMNRATLRVNSDYIDEIPWVLKENNPINSSFIKEVLKKAKANYEKDLKDLEEKLLKT